MLIEDTLDANGDSTQFAEVLDGFVVMPWAVDKIFRVKSISLRTTTSEIRVGNERKNFVVLQKLSRISFRQRPLATFVETAKGLALL